MAGTLDELSILPDSSFAIAVRPTTFICTKNIDAGSPEDVDVPAGAKYVVFGSNGTFAVRYNAANGGTAAATTDEVTGSGCEINPTVRYLIGIAEISIAVTTNGTVVSLAFYK